MAACGFDTFEPGTGIEKARSAIFLKCSAILRGVAEWSAVRAELFTLPDEWRLLITRSVASELATAMALTSEGLQIAPLIAESFRYLPNAPLEGLRGRVADHVTAALYSTFSPTALANRKQVFSDFPICPVELEVSIAWAKNMVPAALGLVDARAAVPKAITSARAACFCTMKGDFVGAAACLRWLHLADRDDDVEVFFIELLRHMKRLHLDGEVGFHLAVIERTQTDANRN
jgi:hypothetical protein